MKCIIFLMLLVSCSSTKISHNFVKITESEYNVILDIKYATENNFTKEKIYKNPVAYLPKEVAEKLKVASEYAKKLGYKIKIFDTYRPLDVQKKLFAKINDENYVSDPDKGVATHTRGVAIDLTLIDLKTGKELDMGTEFDSFEDLAHHNPNSKITIKQLKNRLILSGIMSVSNFTPLPTEWWHFNYRTYSVYPEHEYDNKFPKLTSEQLNLTEY
jgi:D-alanyl-D-alanine dipeptidase